MNDINNKKNSSFRGVFELKEYNSDMCVNLYYILDKNNIVQLENFLFEKLNCEW